MELTPEIKAKIDSLSYVELLRVWRRTGIGNPWFEGRSGEYWASRMQELRSHPGGQQMHVKASKEIGW